jgi:hypothetical protein
LIEIRNYYLKTHKKTLLDESPFKSFGIECEGETIDPKREGRLMMEKKYKERKPSFQYSPENPREVPDYKFANTSGNEINNDKNLRVMPYIDKPELLKNITEIDAEQEQEEDSERAELHRILNVIDYDDDLE